MSHENIYLYLYFVNLVNSKNEMKWQIMYFKRNQLSDTDQILNINEELFLLQNKILYLKATYILWSVIRDHLYFHFKLLDSNTDKKTTSI